MKIVPTCGPLATGTNIRAFEEKRKKKKKKIQGGKDGQKRCYHKRKRHAEGLGQARITCQTLAFSQNYEK